MGRDRAGAGDKLLNASVDNTRYDQCPRCGAGDVKGPYQTPPRPPLFVIERAWFCRRCWWTASKKLHDDVAHAAADLAARRARQANNG
jgi:hypothetical protein